jgi:hypothetical protein
MADPLVILSDTKDIISQGIVVIDYDHVRAFCRHGIWEGWQEIFTETVTLAYEHTVEEYVGWQVNDVTILDPGFSNGTPPWGAPLPGFPTVTYTSPVGGLFHEISFKSSANDPIEKFWVNVLYRTSEEQQQPTYGPGMWVTLSGQYIDWPWFLLMEQRECIQRWLSIFEKISEIYEVATVNPGDPVEWAGGFTPDEVNGLKAGAEILQKIDAKKQPDLAKRIASYVNGILQWRTPGKNGMYGKSPGKSKERR